MATNDVMKTYTGKLFPDERKAAYLKNTFDYLEKGSEFFFDLFMSLYGGVSYSMLQSLYAKNKKVENVDISLWCAIYWFRVVPKDKCKEFSVPQPLIAKRLQQYLNAEPSQNALEYINSNLGEDYHWIDCKEKYKALCRNVGNLDVDLQTMVENGHIPTELKTAEPWGVISSLFGVSKKEDRSKKSDIVKCIIANLKSIHNCTQNEVNAIILEAAGVKTPAGFKAAFAGEAGGRSNRFDIQLTYQGDDLLGEDHIKKLCTSFSDYLSDKETPLNWQNKDSLTTYVIKSIGNKFHQCSFSEMWKNAMADLQPKNTRNYNFAKEKTDLRNALADNADGKQGASILNEFFNSPYFTADNVFVISPSDVGAKNLTALFTAWTNGAGEESIEDFYDGFKHSLDRCPDRCLLKYLHANRNDINAEMIKSGASYNLSFDRLSQKKIHPSVKGRLAFTWAKSALNGILISPSKARRTDVPGSLDARIWVEIELLELDGRWVKHHIPFFNARFYEEVYAQGSSNQSVTFRTPRFGYKPQPQNDTQLAKFVQQARSKSPKQAHLTKRYLRVGAAIKNNTLPQVPWNNVVINIARRDGRFNISAIYKFETTTPKFTTSVGKKVLSFDQNQTTSHSYAIHQIVDEKEGVPFRNHHIRILNTGNVSSTVMHKDNPVPYDQLNYSGLQYEHYFAWRKRAKDFVREWRYGEFLDKKTNTTQTIDFVAQFEERIEQRKWKYGLYQFNRQYAKLLKDIVRRNGIKALPAMKKEILRFLSPYEGLTIVRLGSLGFNTFEAIRAAKGLINCYFAILLGNGGAFDEEKEQADPELWQLYKMIETIRQNKSREKINRIANAIVSLAIAEKVDCIVGEAKLPVATKKSKKSQNNRNIDWVARGIGNKINELCKMHGIHFCDIEPAYTSHQDTLEHNSDFANPTPKFRPRFAKLAVDEIGDWVIRKIAKYLNPNYKADYYRTGIMQFIDKYGLHDYKDQLAKGSMKCWELQKIFEEQDVVQVLVPVHGGRYFLSTQKSTTEAIPITYAGSNYWLSDADQVAAVNIGLNHKLYPTKKKQQQDEVEATLVG